MPIRAVIQTAGFGHRLPMRILIKEFDCAGLVMRLLLRYTHLACPCCADFVCNRHDTVKQQLCRWRLLMLARLIKNGPTLTQELVSNMLGVRREGGTETAGPR
jgi:hypothetical protein